MNTRLVYIIIHFFLSMISSAIFPIYANINEKEFRNAVTTSVIIPCHYKHFKYIPELLLEFQNQTVLPNEIIVSISESAKISQNEIENLLKQEWGFFLKILCNPDKLSAGANRNAAMSNSKGDVLICQDADDVPHPQRIEILKFVFEHFDVDHLMHLWIPPQSEFTHYSISTIKTLMEYCDNPAVLHFCSVDGKSIKESLTNGNVAYTRAVGDLVKWPEYGCAGEDIEFNERVFAAFKNKVIINAELLIYRNPLFSFLLDE